MIIWLLLLIVFPAYAGVILVEFYESSWRLGLSCIRGGNPKHPKNAAGITTSFPHTLDKTYMCGKCGCSSLVVDMMRTHKWRLKRYAAYYIARVDCFYNRVGK